MAKNELKILTYNLACLPHQIEPELHKQRALQMLDSVQKQNIDIACFQEVFSDAAENTLLISGGSIGYTVTHDGIPNDKALGLLGDSGLVTINAASTDFLSSLFIEYDAKAYDTWDWLSEKGALINIYRVAGRSFGFDYLYIVNTHTQSGPASEAQIRQGQLTQALNTLRFVLGAHLTEAHSATGNSHRQIAARTMVLFAGDLNVIGESEEYKRMMRYLAPEPGEQVIDLFRQQHPDDPGYTFDGTENNSRAMKDEYKQTRERLDYILAYKSLRLMGQKYDFFVPGNGRNNTYQIDLAKHKLKLGRIEQDISDHFGLGMTITHFLPPRFKKRSRRLNIAEGTAVSHPIQAYPGKAGETLTLTCQRPGETEEFVSFKDNGNGVGHLDIQPGFDHAGSHQVQITAASPDGLTAVHTLYIHVTNVNRAPVFAEIADQTVYEGDRITVPFKAYDPDGQSLTLSLSQAPDFVQLNDRGHNGGLLTLTPGFEDAGQYTVQVTATDPEGKQATDDFVVTVINVNRAPILQPVRMQMMAEGRTRAVTISASDPDRQDITLRASQLPDFAVFADHGDGAGSVTLKPDYYDSGLYRATVEAVDPEGAVDKVSFGIRVRNRLRSLPTQVTQKAARGQGVLELRVQNWRPNLALQVEIRQGGRWQNVVNENGDRAWFQETVKEDEVIRFGYGDNALNSAYRVVVYDKAEEMKRGWAVSDVFTITEADQHVTVTVTLP